MVTLSGMKNTLVVSILLVAATFVGARETSTVPSTSPSAKKTPRHEEKKPVIAARAFLRLLADSKDKEAYEQFTAEAYRKSHSLEDFTNAANAVRESQLEPNVIPAVEGCVVSKPKADKPRTASLHTGQMQSVGKWRTRRSLAIELVQPDGADRWLITDLRQLEFGDELWEYNESWARNRSGEKRRVCSSVQGTITALKDGSFVLKPSKTNSNSHQCEQDSRELTVTADGTTKVWTTTEGNDGSANRVVATRDAIKEGRPAEVNASEEDGHAYQIDVRIGLNEGGPGL